jgi:hypothetical protein
MSSNSSPTGYTHPSQQYPPQPPYPTTPNPAPSQSQYLPPPPPLQHHQPIYATSPPTQQQRMYSTSPPARDPYYSTSPPSYTMPHHHRRTSSSASHQPRPYFQPQSQSHHAYPSSTPISIPAPQQQHYHTRNSSSYGSQHSTYNDGEAGRHHNPYGLDEDTLREYDARYRKEKAAERRPTLGGSLMSAVGKIGGLVGGGRR